MTSLVLLHFEAPDDSLTYVNHGSENVSLFPIGSANIDTAEFKFGSSSGFFAGNATSDQLNSSGFKGVPDGPWTMDVWVKFNGAALTNRNSFFSLGGGDGGGSLGVNLNKGAGASETLHLNLSSTGASYDIANNVTGSKNDFVLDQWYHIELTFDEVNGKYFVYIDGVADITVTDSTKVWNDSSGTSLFEMSDDTLGGNGFVFGWMDEFRFADTCDHLNGNSFTPPSSPYADEAHAENTTSVILLHGDTVQDPLFRNNGLQAASFTSEGGLSITSTARFGPNSLFFDGTDNHAKSVDFDRLPTLGWTVDCWVEFDAPTTDSYIFSFLNGSGRGVKLGYDFSATKLFLTISTNGTSDNVADEVAGTKSSWVTTGSHWYHIELTYDKAGGKYYVYVDGVVDITIDEAGNIPTGVLFSGLECRIGDSDTGGADVWKGKIDEFRLANVCDHPDGTTFARPRFAYWNPIGVSETLTLLHFNGSDGDVGVANHGTVDKVFDAVDGATLDVAQKKFGASSVLLDGVNDSVEAVGVGPLGVNGWTIDCWVRFSAFPADDQTIYALYRTGAFWYGVRVKYEDSTGFLELQISSAGVSWDIIDGATGSATFSADTWYHIETTFDGANSKYIVYVDGVADIEVVDSRIVTVTDFRAFVGFDDNWNAGVEGWIDEFRITNVCEHPNGVTFSVPTVEYADAADIVEEHRVLLHFEGTDATNVFPNDGADGRPFSASFQAQLDTAQSKFGSASLLLDGSGDKVQGTNLRPLPSRGDGWCIDGWVRFNTHTTDGGIFHYFDAPADVGVMVGWQISGTALELKLSSNGSTYDIVDGVGAKTSWNDDQWYHIAIVRDNAAGSYYLYVDGVVDKTVTTPLQIFDTVDVFWVGEEENGSFFDGWIDEVNVESAVRYPGGTTFSVPTAAYARVKVPEILEARALLHFDGSDASTTITDETGNSTWSVVGGTELDTADFKFGTASAFFGGQSSGDQLESTDSGSLLATSVGWTVEFFYKPDGFINGRHLLFGNTNTTGNGFGLRLDMPSGSGFRLNLSSDGTSNDISQLNGSGMLPDRWHHIAVVWEEAAGAWYVYLDGILDIEVRSHTTLYASMTRALFSQTITQGDQIDGWIDEFRITDGVRYPGGFSFATPTQAFAIPVSVAIVESTAAAESQTRQLDPGGLITESAAAAEALTAIGDYGLSIAESAAAAEVPTADVPGPEAVAIVETVAATEVQTGGALVVSDVTESAAAGESSSEQTDAVGSVTETVAAGATQAENIDDAVFIVETAGATETTDADVPIPLFIVETVAGVGDISDALIPRQAAIELPWQTRLFLGYELGYSLHGLLQEAKELVYDISDVDLLQAAKELPYSLRLHGEFQLPYSIRPIIQTGITLPYNMAAGLAVGIELQYDIRSTDILQTPITLIWSMVESSIVNVTDQPTITHYRGLAALLRSICLFLPGTPNNTASTPDSVAMSIAGDTDLRCKISPVDWNNASQEYIMGRYASSSDAGISLRMNAGGILALDWVDSGSSYHSENATEAVPFVGRTEAYARATLDVDNGASGYTVTFYTSTDYDHETDIGTWDQLGDPVTTGGVTSVKDTALTFYVGSYNGTSNMFTGDVHYADIRDGIDGTIVVMFDPTNDAAIGGTSFTSSTGEVWTINQSGAPQAELVLCDSDVVADGIGITRGDVSASEGGYAWEGNFDLADINDYVRFVRGDSFVVDLYGEVWTFLVDGKELSRRAPADVSARIIGISPSAAYVSPRATLRDYTWATPVTALAVATELISAVSWGVVDWIIPGYRLAFSDAEPMEVVRRLAEACGGTVESDLDGTVDVRPLYPVSPVDYAITSPDQTYVELLDIYATSEAYNFGEIFNKYRILDSQPIESDRIEWIEDYSGAFTGYLRVYPAPWRVNVVLSHTADALEVIIGSQVVMYREERELIEIFKGRGSTAYPIFQIILVEWEDTNLGGLAHAPDSPDFTVVGPAQNSAAYVTYQTRSLNYRATTSSGRPAQFLLESPVE